MKTFLSRNIQNRFLLLSPLHSNILCETTYLQVSLKPPPYLSDIVLSKASHTTTGPFSFYLLLVQPSLGFLLAQ